MDGHWMMAGGYIEMVIRGDQGRDDVIFKEWLFVRNYIWETNFVVKFFFFFGLQSSPASYVGRSHIA